MEDSLQVQSRTAERSEMLGGRRSPHVVLEKYCEEKKENLTCGEDPSRDKSLNPLANVALGRFLSSVCSGLI